MTGCHPVSVTYPPAAPPPPAYGPPPAKPRMPKSLKIALAVVGGTVLFCLSGAVVFVLNGGMYTKVRLPDKAPAVAQTKAAGHEIRFEVTSAGAGAATVNWSTIGDSAILTNESLPWSKTVTLKDSYGLVGVTASAPSGRLTCRLLVDGREVKKNESDLVVNCSDTVTP